jgi:hypothetical protein
MKLITQTKDCKHFTSCSAPLCPLDQNINQRTMLRGEPICRFWREQERGKKTCSISGKGSYPVPHYSQVLKSQNTTLKWGLESIFRVREYSNSQKGGAV